MITLSTVARNESTTEEADLLDCDVRESVFVPADGMSEFMVFNKKEYNRRTAVIDLSGKLKQPDGNCSLSSHISADLSTPAQYKVVLLPSAESDLGTITDELGFLPERNAKRCLNLLRSSLSGLAAAPERYRTLNDPFLADEGYRVMPIGGYWVIFTISGNTVNIHRILFEKEEYKGL